MCGTSNTCQPWRMATCTVRQCKMSGTSNLFNNCQFTHGTVRQCKMSGTSNEMTLIPLGFLLSDNAKCVVHPTLIRLDIRLNGLSDNAKCVVHPTAKGDITIGTRLSDNAKCVVPIISSCNYDEHDRNPNYLK